MNDNDVIGPEKPDLDKQVVQCVMAYKREAESAKIERMLLNKRNYDTYHLRGDFSHKQKGQSREFLGKVAMSVEQITTFVVQGLMDLGHDWFTVEYESGGQNPVIPASAVKKILAAQLEKADFYAVISDSLKNALLGSLSINKIDTVVDNTPKYVHRNKKAAGKITENVAILDKKHKKLRISVVSPTDWFPDPTGRGLFVGQDIEEDLHVVRAMEQSEKYPEGIYDSEALKELVADAGSQAAKAADKARETGQNVEQSGYRKRVQLFELWGTLIDEMGNVLFDNIVCTVANDSHLIRKPQENPFWHQQNPYVVAPLVRVPRSVWHKALMDAAAAHNIALNEIYNLLLDSALVATFGIKQIRMDWLADPSQVNDGIRPGITLKVNALCPINGKVIERVDTGTMSMEAIQLFQITDGEFQQSSMTNDLRLGVMPQRKTQATEVVAAEQAVTGMLNGIAKLIENTIIAPTLNKSWMTIAQDIADFDREELNYLIGEELAGKWLAMSPEKRFVETVNGLRFRVYGLSYTLNKTKDFRKFGMLLQTLGAVPALLQEFAKDYSIQKLVLEVLKSLDLDIDKLKLGETERMENAMPGAPEGGGAPVGADGAMSQVAGASAENSGQGDGQGATIASIAQPQFPPSRATGALP
jgi:hypothetical protein